MDSLPSMFLPVTVWSSIPPHSSPMANITIAPHSILAYTDSTLSYTPCLYLCSLPSAIHSILNMKAVQPSQTLVPYPITSQHHNHKASSPRKSLTSQKSGPDILLNFRWIRNLRKPVHKNSSKAASYSLKAFCMFFYLPQVIHHNIHWPAIIELLFKSYTLSSHFNSHKNIQEALNNLKWQI